MGRGGLGGLKNKLPANNNNGERSTRAAKKQNKKETSFSDFFGYRNVAKWPRDCFSLLFELPHTLPDFFWGGGGFFFFALQKKAQIMHNIVFCGLSSWGETFTSSAGR